uniref:(northern house mosquito) hypothetical protein n=1 Tax=Culex pipiens TaxID=7175 RepID=A0A8D8FM92_CULPI
MTKIYSTKTSTYPEHTQLLSSLFSNEFSDKFPVPVSHWWKTKPKRATSKPNQPWCSGVCEENHSTRKFKYEQLMANPCGLRHNTQGWPNLGPEPNRFESTHPKCFQ